MVIAPSLPHDDTAGLNLFARSGFTHAVVGGINTRYRPGPGGWASLQPEPDRPLDTGASAVLVDALRNTVGAGLVPVLETALHSHAPTWLTGRIEQWNNSVQAWPGKSGQSSADFVFSATARTAIADYITRLVALLAATPIEGAGSGGARSALELIAARGGVFVGGGPNGELLYPDWSDAGQAGIAAAQPFDAGAVDSITLVTAPPLRGSGAWPQPGLATIGAVGQTLIGYRSVRDATLEDVTTLTDATMHFDAGTPITPRSLWAYDATAQRGGPDLAADVSACPLPGYVPFVGGGGHDRSVEADRAWIGWWHGSLRSYLRFLLQTLRRAGYGGTIWVKHPDVGVLTGGWIDPADPGPPDLPLAVATANNYVKEMGRGHDHEWMMQVYGKADETGGAYPFGSVYPDMTGGDVAIGEGRTTAGRALEFARRQGVDELAIMENSGIPDWPAILAPGGAATGYYGVFAAVRTGPDTPAFQDIRRVLAGG